VGVFSGGHDSLVNTHITARHPKFAGVIHIDTGTGIPETQQYVVETCVRLGWDLKIYRAVNYINAKGELDPQIYEEMCLKHGFPGPNFHQRMYNRLKQLPIDQFSRNWHLAADKSAILGLSTGARKAESTRRMRNMSRHPSPWQKDGRRVWISPIADWSKDECEVYMKEFTLPRNSVKDALCMSGECCCGAYAQTNELKQIEFFYPDHGAWLRGLECRVKANGFPWGWDEKPPAWWSKKVEYERAEKNGQLNLFSPPHFAHLVSFNTKITMNIEELNQVKEIAQKIRNARGGRIENFCKVPEYKILRPLVFELFQMKVHEKLGYKSLSRFFSDQVGVDSDRDRYSKLFIEELKFALYEHHVFGVPIGTVSKAVLNQSRFIVVFELGATRSTSYQVNPDLVVQARSAWEGAKQIASSSGRSNPNRNDLSEMVAKAESNGSIKSAKGIESDRLNRHKAHLRRLLKEIKFAQQELKELESRKSQKVNHEHESVSDLNPFFAVESYTERQKSLIPAINNLCRNESQLRIAYENLVARGPAACKRYLRELRDCKGVSL
jgi:3'-phosphoadenosine 5'-phosphosulfate sulfotransferase (PAPS reductase)/FAD synthetase